MNGCCWGYFLGVWSPCGSRLFTKRRAVFFLDDWPVRDGNSFGDGDQGVFRFFGWI